MIPVGLVGAAKASARLRRLKSEGHGYQFSDEDTWAAVEHEGERIIKCLESSKKDFHDEFSLLNADRPSERMGSVFYYTITGKE